MKENKTLKIIIQLEMYELMDNCLQERKVIDNLISEVNLESCRVTNCGPNPKGVGYRPNKPNTINL